MPGMYESDQTIKKQPVGGIHNVKSKETPFLRLLKNGPAPKQMLDEWQNETYDDTGLGGKMDGADITEFNKQGRVTLQNYGIWQDESWMVSKLANVTEIVGMGKTEKARQKMHAAIKLKLKVERTALSQMEAQAQVKPTKEYRTRGAFTWLSPTAQTVLPVPDSFRPGSEFSGALSGMTPTAFEALMYQAAIEKGGPVTLEGFVGLLLKRKMSLWAQRDTESSATAQALQHYNLTAADKQLVQIVNKFEFDAGVVTTIPNFNLAHDIDTGAATAYSPRSGLFVDMSMWNFAALQGYENADLPDLGGGPRGFIDVIYLIRCLNALGQFRVLSNTDS
jgi:hypothetical protein